jgi:hypothetical protein
VTRRGNPIRCTEPGRLKRCRCPLRRTSASTSAGAPGRWPRERYRRDLGTNRVKVARRRRTRRTTRSTPDCRSDRKPSCRRALWTQSRPGRAAPMSRLLHRIGGDFHRDIRREAEGARHGQADRPRAHLCPVGRRFVRRTRRAGQAPQQQLRPRREPSARRRRGHRLRHHRLAAKAASATATAVTAGTTSASTAPKEHASGPDTASSPRTSSRSAPSCLTGRSETRLCLTTFGSHSRPQNRTEPGSLLQVEVGRSSQTLVWVRSDSDGRKNERY